MNLASIFKRDNPWLSQLVIDGVAERYPQFASASHRDILRKRLMRLFQWPITWALLGWLAFTIINEVLVSLGFTLASYSLNSIKASDIIGSLIDIAAVTVGIVLPLIILLI